MKKLLPPKSTGLLDPYGGFQSLWSLRQGKLGLQGGTGILVRKRAWEGAAKLALATCPGQRTVQGQHLLNSFSDQAHDLSHESSPKNSRGMCESPYFTWDRESCHRRFLCSPKCGPWTNSIRIICELGRNTNSQAAPAPI